MQSVLNNTRDAAALPEQPGLITTIFRGYRNDFGLFWRVMLPVIAFSFLFNIALFLFFKLGIPEAQWTSSTTQGVSARTLSVFDSSSGTSQSVREPTGVTSAVGFSASSFHIGFLWLAMCPLAFIIVHQYRGGAVTFGEVWKHTLRKIWTILGGGILLVALVVGTSLLAFLLLFLVDEASIGPLTPIFLFVLIPGVPIAYFMVKWSLYNQGIIIENLSAIAALRRSSELVRGKWGQFFGMYLLLALVTMVFTTAVLGLTLLLFSVISPEFAPLREVLQSGKFLGLFFGGMVKITLESAPIWAIGTMVAINTLIHAILAPIWALLTTHLYMKQAGTEFK